MSVLSSLIGKLVVGFAATLVVGAAPAATDGLPRPTNGHSDAERVSPATQVRVYADACSRDAAKVRLEARLAMSLDDFEEVLRRTQPQGLDAATLRDRYAAVFRDEILKAQLSVETRARTASEIEGDVGQSVVKALDAAERAFRVRTGVTAVVVMEGIELSVDDADCGGPVFIA